MHSQLIPHTKSKRLFKQSFLEVGIGFVYYNTMPSPCCTLSLLKPLLILLVLSFQCNFSDIGSSFCSIGGLEVGAWRGDLDPLKRREELHTQASLTVNYQKKAIRSITLPRLTPPLSHPLCIITLKESLSPTALLSLVYATGRWEWKEKNMSFYSSTVIIITSYFDKLYTICFS